MVRVAHSPLAGRVWWRGCHVLLISGGCFTTQWLESVCHHHSASAFCCFILLVCKFLHMFGFYDFCASPSILMLFMVFPSVVQSSPSSFSFSSSVSVAGWHHPHYFNFMQVTHKLILPILNNFLHQHFHPFFISSVTLSQMNA